MFKKIVSLILSAVICIVLGVGCTKNGTDSSSQDPSIVDYKLNYTQVEMKLNETMGLTITPTPEATVEWSTTGESVVSVNNEGLVTACGLGEAVVTAAFGEYSLSCAFLVSYENIESAIFDLNLNVPISNGSKLRVFQGATYSIEEVFTVGAKVESVVAENVTYYISNESVVSIERNNDGITLSANNIGVSELFAT